LILILTGEPMDYSEGLSARAEVLRRRAREIEERTARLSQARALELVAGSEVSPELRAAFLALRRDALLLQQANYLLCADALGEQVEKEDRGRAGPFDGVAVPDGVPPGGL